MAKLIQIKVRGYTLAEVIVAFIIIMLVFSLAVTVITQTYQADSGLPTLKSFTYADKIKNETVENNEYFDETIENSGLKFERTIKNYSYSKNLINLEIRVLLGSNHEIAKYNYLIPITK